MQRGSSAPALVPMAQHDASGSGHAATSSHRTAPAAPATPASSSSSSFDRAVRRYAQDVVEEAYSLDEYTQFPRDAERERRDAQHRADVRVDRMTIIAARAAAAAELRARAEEDRRDAEGQRHQLQGEREDAHDDGVHSLHRASRGRERREAALQHARRSTEASIRATLQQRADTRTHHSRSREADRRMAAGLPRHRHAPPPPHAYFQPPPPDRAQSRAPSRQSAPPPPPFRQSAEPVRDATRPPSHTQLRLPSRPLEHLPSNDPSSFYRQPPPQHHNHHPPSKDPSSFYHQPPPPPPPTTPQQAPTLYTTPPYAPPLYAPPLYAPPLHAPQHPMLQASQPPAPPPPPPTRHHRATTAVMQAPAPSQSPSIASCSGPASYSTGTSWLRPSDSSPASYSTGTSWLRPSDSSLRTSREEMRMETTAARRHAAADDLSRAAKQQRVFELFATWRAETFAAARLDDMVLEIRARHGRQQRKRRLAEAWRLWHSRRALLYFRSRHESWLRSFLSSHRVVRIFARPYLVRGWQRWQKHAIVVNRRPLQRARYTRGVAAFVAERVEARRAAKKMAIVASLQFAAIQYLQLQSCCKAWTSWLSHYYGCELATPQRHRLRQRRRARLRSPSKALGLAVWRRYVSQVHTLRAHRAVDRYARAGCSILARELAQVEGLSTRAAEERRSMLIEVGFLKDEFGQVERELDAARMDAAREARNTAEATRQSEMQRKLAGVAIKRAEEEAQRAAAATAVAAATAAAAARAGGAEGAEGVRAGDGANFKEGATTFEGFALREAASENSIDMILQQLDRSPNTIDETDPESGNTALLIACERGHASAARTLADRGANLEHKSRSGWTALGLACAAGNEAVVSALLSRNASVDAPVEDGLSPLMVASENGNLEISRSLLGNRADPNLVADDGSTALMLAAEHGHAPVVRALIGASADANKKLPDGTNALGLAQENGHLELASLLTQVTDDVPPPPLNYVASPRQSRVSPMEAADASAMVPSHLPAPASEVSSTPTQAPVPMTLTPMLSAVGTAPPVSMMPDAAVTPGEAAAASIAMTSSHAPSQKGMCNGIQHHSARDDDEAPTGPAAVEEENSSAGAVPGRMTSSVSFSSDEVDEASTRSAPARTSWLGTLRGGSATPTSQTGGSGAPTQPAGVTMNSLARFSMWTRGGSPGNRGGPAHSTR